MTEQQPEELATIPTEDAGATPPNGPGSLDVVRIYNEELDAYGESPRAGLPFLQGWEVVEPTAEEAQAITSYDPAAHSIAEVNQHLEEHPEELSAILALEREGKNRSTLISSLESRQAGDEEEEPS